MSAHSTPAGQEQVIVYVIESRMVPDFDGSQSVGVFASLDSAKAHCEWAAKAGHIELRWHSGIHPGGAMAHDKAGLPGDLPVFIIKRFEVKS